MLRDFAWNAFEMTGNPDAYVFFKEVSNLRNKEENPPEEAQPDNLQG